MEYTVETRCLHLEEEKNKDKDFGSVSFPIYQTATFAHYGVGSGHQGTDEGSVRTGNNQRSAERISPWQNRICMEHP